jgi:hypothetical protein
MNRKFQILASRGAQIVFDEIVTAETPRDARRELKRRLGLTSLSGIVFSSSEIPVDQIAKIVKEQVAPLLKRIAKLEKALRMPADARGPARAERFNPFPETL